MKENQPWMPIHAEQYFTTEDPAFIWRVKFVTNDRYREVDGKYFKDKWTAYYRNYREFEGMMIPTEGEVEWNLFDKDLQYAKLKITDIQYNISSKY